MLRLVTVAETAVAAHQISQAPTLASGVSEAAVGADSLLAVAAITGAYAETAQATAVVNFLQSGVAAYAEAGGLQDSFAPSNTILSFSSEAFVPLDQFQSLRQFFAGAAESGIAFADGYSPLPSLGAGVGESLTTLDGGGVVFAYGVSLFESPQIEDNWEWGSGTPPVKYPLAGVSTNYPLFGSLIVYPLQGPF
jgi:hypothetical protein